MKLKDKIKGIFPAVITPFKKNGEIDEKAYRNYLNFLTETVDGLFIAGSYGSGPLMSPEQRKEVAEITMDEVGNKVPVILHVGYSNTETTIELAKHGEKLGVDVLAAVTPYYYKHRRKAVVNHYEQLIDAVDTPVMLYNNPKYTQFELDEELLVQLADYGLRGLKDSSGNIGLFYNFINQVEQDDFLFLIGSQTLLVPAIVGGADGCVSGLSNAYPEFIVEIYNLCKEEKYEEASKLQQKANVLRKITGEGIPIPFYHTVMRELGMDIGYCKAPFTPLEEDKKEEVLKALDELDMLVKY
jgi:dihydrodipicolinate synthase/N-acetylneuraminate lyase